MAYAEFHEVLSVDKEALLAVIVDYEKYTEFVEGIKNVEVLNKTSDKIRVKYDLNIMSKDVSYTLDHQEDRSAGKVEWSLIESGFFKKNDGKWLIKEVSPGKTDVFYSLDVEFKIPVPGFILNRLIKGSLPSMVRSFEKMAKKR